MSDFLVSEEFIAELLVDHALSTVGTKESGGNNEGAAIAKFQKAVDGVASKEPWCMGWLYWVIKQACDDLAAIVPFPRTEHCMTAWRSTPTVYKRNLPERGFVVIFQGSGDSGHTGLCTSHNVFAGFATIEGNTNEGGSREGNMVAKKLRFLIGNRKLKVVGFIDLPAMIFDSLERKSRIQ